MDGWMDILAKWNRMELSFWNFRSDYATTIEMNGNVNG